MTDLRTGLLSTAVAPIVSHFCRSSSDALPVTITIEHGQPDDVSRPSSASPEASGMTMSQKMRVNVTHPCSPMSSCSARSPSATDAVVRTCTPRLTSSSLSRWRATGSSSTTSAVGMAVKIAADPAPIGATPPWTSTARARRAAIRAPLGPFRRRI